jgi:uncharacterized DUF497 family protein
MSEDFESGGRWFEWNQGKATMNREKHGVDFREAATTFDARHAVEAPQLIGDEERWLIIAMSARGRILASTYTYRGKRIRLISSRPANRRERNEYFQGRWRRHLR